MFELTLLPVLLLRLAVAFGLALALALTGKAALDCLLTAEDDAAAAEAMAGADGGNAAEAVKLLVLDD